MPDAEATRIRRIPYNLSMVLLRSYLEALAVLGLNP